MRFMYGHRSSINSENMQNINNMEEKILGVLGGIGPLATVYFMDMLVRKTDAKNDQEHVSALVFNHAAIPDRTDYILDNSKNNPLPIMKKDAQLLEKAGVDYIVIPCNTAHYFYDEIQKAVKLPVINIVHETVKHIVDTVENVKNIGIMATSGTVEAKTYQRECEKFNIGCIVPDENDQKMLMEIIYGQVKAGKEYDLHAFLEIIDNLKRRGADAVVLGCTELSVIHADIKIPLPDVVDSLSVLAEESIRVCGKKILL